MGPFTKRHLMLFPAMSKKNFLILLPGMKSMSDFSNSNLLNVYLRSLENYSFSKRQLFKPGIIYISFSQVSV